MENTHHIKYSVNSYEVDPRGKARLTTIANFLQETAYKHAHTLELGYEHLKKNNSAWILSRLRIKMHNYPDWDEVVSVETWPRGIEKLFAIRDFRICNKKGDIIAVAETCWLMVDLISHRPMRITPDFIKIETRTDAVFEKTIGKIELPDFMQFRSRFLVQYSDLDIVGHVNNVKFIEWCMDVIDVDLVLNKEVNDFEINFLNEALIGDEIQIFSTEVNADSIILSGRKTGSEKKCFIARLRIAE